MVGRLSIYAKNRILNLRFQKNNKIKHIAQTLLQEDNIKVSRESISTFLKKYIDTKSILDKPRSGRNKKLTKEEIELIGEVTRLNRDITAPKIKQYLNLNVSTHTILRASKLFEWNKNNPNSNQAKRAAAMERQINGEISIKKRRSNRTKKKLKESVNEQNESLEKSSLNSSECRINYLKEENKDQLIESTIDNDLNLIDEKEILSIKNLSSSPMVFATRILMRIFNLNELYGHNVSGKTFSKNVKSKKPLDEKRIRYIRWLVENHFESLNKENQWKLCRTAINKIILINEKKATKNQIFPKSDNIKDSWKLNDDFQRNMITCVNSGNPISNLISETSPDIQKTFQMKENHALNSNDCHKIVSNKQKAMYDKVQINDKQQHVKYDTVQKQSKSKFSLIEQNDERISEKCLNEEMNLKLISEKEIILIKNLYCSPMIFATKILFKIFTPDELYNHNLSGKAYTHNNRISRTKKPLEETRVQYIKYLVEKYFDSDDKELLWKSCRKAIGRVLRTFEKKSNNDQIPVVPLFNQQIFNDDKESVNSNLQYNDNNVFTLDQNCLDTDSFNSTEPNIQIKHSIYLDDSAKHNLVPFDSYSNSNNILQSDKRHTVVVLVDDPEQQRQMMLEQELEDNEKLEMFRQQNVSNTFQNLTTVTVLNLEPAY